MCAARVRRTGDGPTCDHWALRDAAAAVVARICSRFGEPYYSLQVGRGAGAGQGGAGREEEEGLQGCLEKRGGCGGVAAREDPHPTRLPKHPAARPPDPTTPITTSTITTALDDAHHHHHCTAHLCNAHPQVKVSKQLLRALLDGSKPLPTHYGAVAGLAALGPATVRLLLLPQLEPYLNKLQPSLPGGGLAGAAAAAGGSVGAAAPSSGKEGVRQFEATRVYGALLQVRA